MKNHNRFFQRYLCKSYMFLIFLIIMVHPKIIAKEARIKVYFGRMSSWSIDRLLFGRFIEHHGTDIYPGMYAQYIINSSYEKWYSKDASSPTPLRDVKPWLVFEDIPFTDGIAYPWEPINSQIGIKYELSGEAFNSDFSQKIINRAENTFAGIKQRLALPDYRVSKFRVKLYAKSLSDSQKIDVELVDYASKIPFDTLSFELTSEWQVYEGILDLKTRKASSKLCNHQGIYELLIGFKGVGKILLDQTTLFPMDAVEGVWNPESIANLKEFGITTIRWPGGNFASGYHWKDGIGPLEQRPTKPNLAWAGLEPNHVGTDEFLHYCELVGLTPLICVGFGYTTPKEAAEWVEYCNGSTSTYYGNLRAQNGHPEPYNVKLWQIGNEVYGSYQIGHTYAEDYANRYLKYYDAMKAVDPSIKIMVMGRDPGYPTNDYNSWNKKLFTIIKTKMDYIDIHRYVRGFRNKSELYQWDLTHLAEIYLTFNNQYDLIINSIRQVAEKYSVPNVKLAVTEWALVPYNHEKLPHINSQANGIFYAGMLNTFIRNGDFMRISCSHDLNLFVQPRPYRNTPVLPRSFVSKMYSEIAADRVLDVDVHCETFDMEKDVPQMTTIKNIPYLDAVALSTKDKREVDLFVVNRSLTSDYDVYIKFDGLSGEGFAEVTSFTVTGDPMDRENWGHPSSFKIINDLLPISKGNISLNIPLSSVMKVTLGLEYQIDENDTLTNNFKLAVHPNPFNFYTAIDYKIPSDAYVEIKIYNLRGQLVTELVKKYQRKGKYSIDWFPEENFGNSLASGVYFCDISIRYSNKKKLNKIIKILYIN